MKRCSICEGDGCHRCHGSGVVHTPESMGHLDGHSCDCNSPDRPGCIKCYPHPMTAICPNDTLSEKQQAQLALEIEEWEGTDAEKEIAELKRALMNPDLSPAQEKHLRRDLMDAKEHQDEWETDQADRYEYLDVLDTGEPF